MNRHFINVTLVLLSCWLSVAVAFAQSPPVADTYVTAGQPNQNFGHAPSMAIGIQSNAYMRFNLGNIPPNSTVTKATLRLYVDGFLVPGHCDVYEIDQPWNEFLMTWNNAPPLGSSATGNNPIQIGLPNNTTFVLVDITDLVQQWVNGTVPNNGIALALTTSYGSFTLETKENTETSHEPELEVALAGAQGAQGPQGPPGPEGPAGPQGDQGPAGSNGTNGQGFTFRNAFSNGTSYNPYDVVTYSGSTYEATVAIPAGGGTPDQNSNWSLWAQVGAPGQQGAQGAQGPSGPAGPQGPQGDQGPAGSNGTNGQGFTFRNAFSNGTSYNPYDVVTYSGSTYEATVAIPAGGGTPDQNSNWSLWAQVGAPGQQGAQGAQGPAGPQGPQGDQGPAGSNGTNGQGFTFRTAFNNGTNYNPYDVVTYSGSTYEATVAIPAGGGTPDQNSNWSLWAQVGAPGQQGAQGAQGPSGPAGPQGPQGDQGPAGSNGTNGQGFTFRNAFSNGTSYNPYDVVTYSGSTYEATVAIPAGGGTPDQNSNWSLWAQVGAQGQQGAQGAQGPAGATGPQGPEGPQGPQGLPGNLNPGSPYYIQNGSSLQTSASFNVDGSGSVGTNYQIGGVPVLNINTTNSTLMLGPSAGNNISTYSTFLGLNSGASDSAGQNTVAVGYNSGVSLNGGDNTLVGTNSGYALGTGGGPASSQNTFVGSGAGQQFTFGTGNILLGYQAGWNSVGGNYNIIIGDNSGDFPGQYSNSNIYISNSETGLDNNTIRIGTQGAGNGQQNQVFIAGIVGSTISNGSAVFVDSSGRLGVGSSGSSGVTSFNGRTGAVVPANNDYSFSQLTGSLGGSQLAGTYSGPLVFSNGSNQFSGIFSGDGSGLTNVSASSLAAGTYGNQVTFPNSNNSFSGSFNGAFSGSGAGLTSVNATTLGGLTASGFIQNTTAQQASSNFNVSGTGTAATFNASGAYQIGGSNFINTPGGSVAVGFSAGSANSDGSSVFVGNQTGQSNTTGTANTFAGSSAGAQNLTASDNTFVGTNAGTATTTGGFNTFLGAGTGIQNITGTNSTYVGVNAGGFATGGYNTFVGANTGQGVGTGVRDTYVGANISVDADGSDNIYLGYGISQIESSTIRIGSQTNPQTRAFISGINGTPLSGGSYVVVNSSGQLGTGSAAGTVVTSFNGRTGAVTPAANDYGFSLLSGTLGNSQLTGTYSGAITLSNTSNHFTGTSFTGNGSGLTNVTASAIAAGTYANAVSFSSTSNTFTGSSFTGGSFTGNGAGLTSVPVTSGSSFYIQNGTTQQASSNFNISGNGIAAGTLTATTAVNTAGTYQIGAAAVLQAQGTSLSVGLNAGALSGTGNTFLGALSGQQTTSGGANVFLGHAAGKNNTTGNSNIFIGDSAGVNNTTGAGNIYIANSGTTGDSSTIRIGEGGGYNTYIDGIYTGTVSNGVPVYIGNNDHLGTMTSSRRFKEDILDMGAASSKLFDLRPVTFFYKPQYDDGTHIQQYGLIAEEVAEVYPDLVVYEKDGTPYSVKYQTLAPMLLNELQKQHKIVADQQDVIKTQQNQIDSMQQADQSQKDEIEALQRHSQDVEQRLLRLEGLIGKSAASPAPASTSNLRQ